MIIIGPGFLLLILLCMFRPVRQLIGVLLLLGLAFGVYACATMPPQ